MTPPKDSNLLSFSPRLLLQRELERRCQNNPKYSLRAFAKALKMSPAALSYALTGKRQVSGKIAQRIAHHLSLSSEESLAWNQWSTAPRNRASKSGLKASKRLPIEHTESDPYQLSLDSFSFISDWFHYGILSLLEISGARFEAKWLARHLGISEIEAKAAMERLQRLGIVKQVRGQWKQASGPIQMASEVPTAATKKFQKQLLSKAIESMENDPDECKDLSSMTLAMDPALIPYARERIREFRRLLTAELESQGTAQRVYKLTVQIFPVSLPITQPSHSEERE